MSPTPNDKSSSSPDLVTRRDAAAKGTIPHPVLCPNVVCRGCTGQLIHISRMRANRILVHSPLSSPRQDTNSPSVSVKKESLDDDRRASTRTSGSARTSVVDDHTGVDPLSLHILKRTGTEAQLKYRGSGTIPGDEGMRSRQGSVSLHPEPTP